LRKFLILLKKEVRELLTMQVILPLLITAILFFALGNILSKEQEKTTLPIKVAVLDQDQTPQSASFQSVLQHSNVEIEQVQISNDEKTALELTKNENKTALIVVPAGFGRSIGTDQPQEVKVYTLVKGFSVFSGQSYGRLMTAISNVNEIFSQNILTSRLPNLSSDQAKNPIKIDEFTVVGTKQANLSPNIIMGFVSQQTSFIPIILFIVIIFSSQMIATAIANEKENKTLETLLTTPVSRNAIVVSKMAAAGLIALIASLVYILSFRSYMNGLTGGMKMTADISQVITDLGLKFTPESYLLMGLSLFAGILVALSISLILGAFAEDVKSVAGLTAPIMVMVMIPYFLTLFLDINTFSPTLRNLTLAIPFSHVFLAAPNLFMHNYFAVVIGIIYQLIWFALAVYIATRIFSTDKIVTLKLNFSRKKLF